MGRITKLEAIKLLADVPEEHKFWCADGNVFKNLSELDKALNKIDENAFKHHVNKEKNDFSNWIRDIIQDETLAGKVIKARNKKSTINMVKKRVSILKNLTKNKKS